MRRQRKPGRGKAKWIFLLLLLLGGGGYWAYRNYEPSMMDEREKEVIVLSKFTAERPLMGTTFGITVYAPDKTTADAAIAEAFAVAEAVNQACSDYLEDSELTRLNSAPAGQWVRVSPDLLPVLNYGLELAELTEGSFDPTLGQMTHLWRETRRLGMRPSGEVLGAARAGTGWRYLETDSDRLLARRNLDDLRIDLGGIAKGFAADRMLETLTSAGLPQALVAAGGDVRCGEAPPGEPGWKVALKNSAGDLTSYIVVSECSVSTSGDLHQFVEIDGIRYSHIIDPKTGLGLSSPVLATIIAPNGLMSDPLATTACVNPEFFESVSPATEIHYRIITSKGSMISRGFPEIEPLLPTGITESGEEESTPDEAATEETPAEDAVAEEAPTEDAD